MNTQFLQEIISGRNRGKRFHRNANSGSPGIVCKHCGNTVRITKTNGPSKVRHLLDHAKWHLDFRPITCPFCDYKAKESNTVRAHLRSIHKTSVDPNDSSNEEPYRKQLFEATKQYFPGFAETLDVYYENCKNGVTSRGGNRRTKSFVSSVNDPFDYFSLFGVKSGQGSSHSLSFNDMNDEPMESSASDFQNLFFGSPLTLHKEKDEEDERRNLEEEALRSLRLGLQTQRESRQTSVAVTEDGDSSNGESIAKPFKLPTKETPSTASTSDEAYSLLANENRKLRAELTKLREENNHIVSLLGQTQSKKAQYKREKALLQTELEMLKKKFPDIVELD